ncbi:hypothetical protein G6F20_012731 [Rhizopus arrhizus]|nr:hypothetical protein G6F20_012731 [Rhizopus arrhizus]
MVASNKDNNNFQHNRQNNGYARRSTIICHWCNKPGHMIADCRTRIRDIKEFEQSRIRQNRQYKRTRPFRNHLVNNIDSMEFHTSNNDTLPKRNNDCSFDSVNKDSLIDLSLYSFDFSQDRAFLLNTNAKNSTLPTYKIYMNGHAFNALIDSGASSNYIHPKVLKFVESYHPVKNQAVETANGEQTIIHGEATCKMEIRGEEKNFISTFKAFVFESKFDIILGNSWLKQVKPKPDWFDSTWTIALPDSSMVVLHPVKEPTSLIKKQNEANYLISAKQLERLYKTKQIEECYFAQVHLKENEMVYLNNINDIDASWSTEFSKEFPEVFKGEITGLPPMRDTQDIIVTKPDTVPVSRPPYKMSPLELSELQKQLNELLNKGLIEPCASEWSNPVLFVRKPNGDLRMCCDYRMLNKVTLKQKIQLPRIDECLERLHNAKHFTSLDLTNGFHQQRITEADSIKTAISTRYGQFCWKVVPFGLSNSGPAFQKMMNSVLSEYIDKFINIKSMYA